MLLMLGLELGLGLWLGLRLVLRLLRVLWLRLALRQLGVGPRSDIPRGQVGCHPLRALRYCIGGGGRDVEAVVVVLGVSHHRGRAARGLLPKGSLLVLGRVARASFASVEAPLGPGFRLPSDQLSQGLLVNLLVNISPVSTGHLE